MNCFLLTGIFLLFGFLLFTIFCLACKLYQHAVTFPMLTALHAILTYPSIVLTVQINTKRILGNVLWFGVLELEFSVFLLKRM